MRSDSTTPLDRERHRLLVRLDRALELPMLVLGLVWVVLIVLDLLDRLNQPWTGVSYGIWGLFVLQFVVQFVIAPRKTRYLRRHWITAISLLAPALRLMSIFRLARAFTVARGARLVRVIGGANRGMRILGRVMDRRGFGYVALLTVLVALAGGAGIHALERGVNPRFESYGSSVWWTAMTLTTMGTDHFPVTGEARFLTLLLAIYGFAVFGYVTAAVASYFVARDADDVETEIAGRDQLRAIQRDLAAIQATLALDRDASGAVRDAAAPRSRG